MFFSVEQLNRLVKPHLLSESLTKKNIQVNYGIAYSPAASKFEQIMKIIQLKLNLELIS